MDAADFVCMIEVCQVVKIFASEQIVFRYECISKEKLMEFISQYVKSPYKNI